jgi:Lon-like protease
MLDLGQKREQPARMARRSRPAAVTESRSRSWWWVLLAMCVLIGGAGVALHLVPADTVALVPREPVDLSNKIRVDGKRTEPMHGKVFLVGVEERQLSLLQRALLSFDDTVSFHPKAGDAERQLKEQFNKRAITDSKESAAAAAFELLDVPVTYDGDGAVVDSITRDSPARRLLKPGDRIVLMNGARIKTAVDVTRRIAKLKPGSRVRFGVRRAGQPAVATFRTIPPEKGDTTRRSRIGLQLGTSDLDIKLSRKVDFKTTRVVGPSAGLAFALALYDSLDPGDLLRGRQIVVTGALYLEGDVLEVGGVREKAIAAQNSGKDIFVVPYANRQAAVDGVRTVCPKGTPCTDVLPVRSVEHAVELLELDSARLEEHLAK